jgi:branched-chain amino acid transport system permease protein
MKTIQQMDQRIKYLLFTALYASLAFLPHIGVIKFGTMNVFAYIAIYSVVALGLNLLLGFSGLISLSTAGFIGVGALGVGVFLNNGFPLIFAIPAVLIIAGGIGALIGLFSLKVDGIYLAIATLFVSEIISQIFRQVPIFGGQVLKVGGITFFQVIELNQISQTDRSILFVIITLVLGMMMIVFHNIVHSKTGRALLAMSRSEHAAQAMGISILRYRLIAFVSATMFATLGGVLYVLYYQNVQTNAWGLGPSLFLVAMVVVGGLKSIYGTILGVFIIHGVPQLILNDIFGDIGYVFSGVLIIVVIIFYPYGFIHISTDIKKWRYNFQQRRAKRGDSNAEQ